MSRAGAALSSSRAFPSRPTLCIHPTTESGLSLECPFVKDRVPFPRVSFSLFLFKNNKSSRFYCHIVKQNRKLRTGPRGSFSSHVLPVRGTSASQRPARSHLCSWAPGAPASAQSSSWFWPRCGNSASSAHHARFASRPHAAPLLAQWDSGGWCSPPSSQEVRAGFGGSRGRSAGFTFNSGSIWKHNNPSTGRSVNTASDTNRLRF